MNDGNRVKQLRLALQVFGVVFIVGIYPLTIVWPSGWAWHAGQSEYLQMIMAIYGTLGDVPALFVIAAVLGWLSPQALTFRFARGAG